MEGLLTVSSVVIPDHGKVVACAVGVPHRPGGVGTVLDTSWKFHTRRTNRTREDDRTTSLDGPQCLCREASSGPADAPIISIIPINISTSKSDTIKDSIE